MKARSHPPDGASALTNRSRPQDGAHFHRTVDGVPGCIWVADATGQIVYANKMALATLGRPLRDLLGQGWFNSLDSSCFVEAQSRWAHSIRTKRPLNAIWRFRQYDGTHRWLQIKAEVTTYYEDVTFAWYVLGVDVDEQAEPHFNEDWNVYRWYALNRDIDDLYHSRELLREREFQLNLLTETLPALLWKAEPDGALVYVNRKATEYTGRTFQELQRDGWVDLVHPDDLEETQRLWQ